MVADDNVSYAVKIIINKRIEEINKKRQKGIPVVEGKVVDDKISTEEPIISDAIPMASPIISDAIPMAEPISQPVMTTSEDVGQFQPREIIPKKEWIFSEFNGVDAWDQGERIKASKIVDELVPRQPLTMGAVSPVIKKE